MPEYVRNELKRMTGEIYKIRERLERMYNSLSDKCVDVDVYRSENQLNSDEDFTVIENMEEAADKIRDTVDDLLDITTLLELAYGENFES